MGNLSSEFILYCLFLIISLGTGAIFWVIHKYRIPAVLSLIIALLAPLLTLLITAQRNIRINAYDYIIEEMSAGSAWARLVVILHAYLAVWLLFLIVRGIIYFLQSPKVHEIFRKLRAKIQLPVKSKADQDRKSS